MDNKSLEKFEVTPMDFAGTYDSFPGKYDFYLEILSYFEENPGATPVSWAKSKGFSSNGSLAGYNSHRLAADHVIKGTIPHSIKGIEELNRLGVFEKKDGEALYSKNNQMFDPRSLEPVKLGSDVFELLFLLSVFLHWTGSFSKAQGQSVRRAVVTSRGYSNNDFVSGVIKELHEMGWITYEEDRDDGGNQCKNYFLDGRIARIMSLFGVHEGNKKEIGSGNLSMALCAVDAFYKSKDPYVQEVAYKMLKTYLCMLFELRGTDCVDDERRSLVSTPSFDVSVIQSEQFEKILAALEFADSNCYPQRLRGPSKKSSPSSSLSVLRVRDRDKILLDELRRENRSNIMAALMSVRGKLPNRDEEREDETCRSGGEDSFQESIFV